MRWKTTVIVRSFQYMSFIWGVNNNNFLSLNYVDFGLEDEERSGQPKKFED